MNSKTKILIFTLISINFLFYACEKEDVDNPNPTTQGITLVKVSGDNQSDTVGLQLTLPLKVKLDSLGIAIWGDTVNFLISSGGGSLSSTNVITDSNGFAEVFWTLGLTIGTQTVSVSADVFEGSPQVFSATAIASSITDSRDGEVYTLVHIGNQCWMAENLRYILFSSTNYPSSTYGGRLYDWQTVMNSAPTSSSNPSGVQGICPTGFHLPSDSEWNELEMALGMSAVDTAYKGQRGNHGTQMKSLTGWNNNGNGTNTSGFNAFPAGFYHYSASFYGLGLVTTFWSSTKITNNFVMVWTRSLSYDGPWMERYDNFLEHKYSCRCVEN